MADMRQVVDPFTVGVGLMGAGERPVRIYCCVACPRCAGIVVIEANYEPDNVHLVVSVSPERRLATDVGGLPADVASYYGDAIVVLEAGVPDAAAVQLRRTLEAAAAHFGVRSSNLVRAIEQLIANGLVTQQFGKVLHHIRAVGNIGAHASDARVDQASAERALRFTTQVLRNLFEVPAELLSLDGSSTARAVPAQGAAHDAAVVADTEGRAGA